MESRFHFQREIIAKQQKQIDNIYKMNLFPEQPEQFQPILTQGIFGDLGFV